VISPFRIFYLRARGVGELLRARKKVSHGKRSGVAVHFRSALSAARTASELAEKTDTAADRRQQDYVQTRWILGAAHLGSGNLAEAENYLSNSLERCRRINLALSVSGLRRYVIPFARDERD
jgi:hypothetical protein